jgi:cyclopropane fatty-acyl-phospholipid synthase-like methyltransferase
MVEMRRVPIAEADPYLLFGLLGKQVIHPGGRKATEELLEFAALARGQQVLDIGCGAGTTAIEMAKRFQVSVTAADISLDMRERAIANVETSALCPTPTVNSIGWWRRR